MSYLEDKVKMKFGIELRGIHGERIIIGTYKKIDNIPDLLALANRMEDTPKFSERVDKPFIYIPGDWLSGRDPDGS